MADIYACSGCHKRFHAEGFKSNRLGERHKTCIECSQRRARERARTLCEHKRSRAQCVDCDGSAICIHKRQRYLCVDCDGSGICEHKRQRRSCRVCADPAGYIEGCCRYALITTNLWKAPPGLDFTMLELIQHIHPLLAPGMTLGQRSWRIEFVVPLDEGIQTHALRLERMRLPNIKISPRE